MPQVSVIIPTYNRADLLRETLDSVFAQSFTDYELIVIDDGSSDDTAERLRPLAGAGRIRYLGQANAGISAARNRGLAEARAEFVAFLDDDDLWPTDKLAWQVEYLRAHRDVAIIGGLVEIMDEREGSTEIRPNFAEGTIQFETSFGGNPFESPGQWLARTTAIRQLGGFDARFPRSEDFDLVLRAVRTTRVVGVHRLALQYRKHAGSISQNFLHMLASSHAVVQSNLKHVSAKRRSEVSRLAHRYLYQYAGMKTLLGALDDLRRGRRARATEAFREVRRIFWRPFVRDVWGFLQITAVAIRRRLRPGTTALV